MQLINYSDFCRSLSSVMDAVNEDQRAVLIHRDTGGNAVILSESAYSSMQETLYLLSTHANTLRLMSSVEQVKIRRHRRSDR